MKKTALVLRAAFAVSAFALSVHAKDSLTETMRAIARDVLADQINVGAAKKRLDDAGVKLGTWHRIGPFRENAWR